MKFCPQCGTQLDDSVMFCSNCGAPVGAAPAQAAPAPAQEVPVQAAAAPVNPEPAPAPEAYAPQPQPQMNYAQPNMPQGGYDAGAFANQGYVDPNFAGQAYAGQGYVDPNFAGQGYAGQGFAQPDYSAAGFAPAGFASPNPGVEAEKPRPAGLSIASFILSFFVVTAPIALILGIVALATKNRKKGLAIAAIIISVLGTGIIVGVMAPQLVKYTEKTNVSSDTQLCDSVKTSITVAMMDPSVIASYNNGIPTGYGWQDVEDINENTAFGEAVSEILGFPISEIESHIKSHYRGSTAYGMQFQIVGSNHVEVRIQYSDYTGKKGTYGSYPIEVN